MKKLDSLILKAFQYLADLCQNWFGADNFFLAKSFFLINWFFMFAESNMKMNNAANFVNTVLSLLLHALLTLLILPIVMYGERSCRNNPQFKNPCVNMISIFRPFYILIAGFVTFSLAAKHFWDWEIKILSSLQLPGGLEKVSEDKQKICEWLDLFESWSFLFFLYFGSCTPKPPQEGRLAKWLARLTVQTAS